MSLAEEFERLQALRDRGVISEEEFVRAKAQTLGTSASGAGDTSGTAAGGAAGAAPEGRSFLQQLARSRSDRYIGGVCGGLGHHTDLPSWAWRLIFCLTLLYFGAGLLIYILLWLFLPQEP
jgi:phage shock protein C